LLTAKTFTFKDLPMNLNQLKLFYLAVKRKSLSIAADELNITQPAVTKGIQRLQEQYGIKLFNRLGKQPELTTAGKDLFEIAEKIFELERLADDRMQDCRKDQMKRIEIHASESFGAYYLPEFINRFNASNPSIKFVVNVLSNQQVVENTLNLKNDLGFISCRVKNKKLLVREILEDELVVIVHPNHDLANRSSVDARDFVGQSMIMHEQGSYFQEVIENLLEANHVRVDMPITLSNNEAIKRAVAGGTGIAPISRKVADQEIDSGRLVALPLTDGPVFRKFSMIHHRDKFLSGPLERLIDMIMEASREVDTHR
jgi:DNA-binding transcriptional LysR family regulator